MLLCDSPPCPFQVVLLRIPRRLLRIVLLVQVDQPRLGHLVVAVAVLEQVLDPLHRLILGQWGADLLVPQVAVVLHLFTRTLDLAASASESPGILNGIAKTHFDDAQRCRTAFQKMSQRGQFLQVPGRPLPS